MPPGPPMSSYASSSRMPAAWPAPTPPPPSPLPSPPGPSKRKRHLAPAAPVDHPSKRQIIADQDQIGTAAYNCQVFSGNNIQSCFPTADTVVPQHEWATFVWNSRLPQLTQTNLVNIYLFRADSGALVNKWSSWPNPTDRAGTVTYQVNDTWFGAQGANWNGQNISYPFYWMITRSDAPETSGDPQTTFSAVQTTYADSVLASMASTSAAGSSASASAASASSLSSLLSAQSAASASASAASLSLTAVPVPTTRTFTSDGHTYTSTGSTTILSARPSGTGNIQGGNNGSSFPHWAIAVIVVLGFFAIVATVILIWLLMRRMRDRRSREASARNSMNSASPMIQNAQNAGVQSPLMGEATLAGAALGAGAASHKPESVAHDKGDGASTISRAHSESAPFSGADAAIMADAFRKALRKPEFPGAVEEGDTPESQKERREAELLSRELADEGRAVRSVASSRDVRVQNPGEGEHMMKDNRSSFDGH